MNSRLFSIIRKEFIQIFRDPRTLALILVMPIIQLFLLCYAATTDVRNVPIALWDRSRSPESRALLDAFRAADYFRFAYEVYSNEEIQTLIEGGEVLGALVIPSDYSLKLLEGKAQVSMILDGSDATVGSTALSTARLIGQSHSIKVLTEQAARQGRATAVQPPLDVRTQVLFNPDLRSAYFMIPGVMGMVLYAIMAMLTATAVVRERERGTIEQLIVTPIRSWELIVGKVTPFVILGFFQFGRVVVNWSLLVWRPYSQQFPARGWRGRLVIAFQSWDRPVCLHHSQHTTGGIAHRLCHDFAWRVYLWFSVSARSNATNFADHFVCCAASVLPRHQSFFITQRSWL